jgi:DNA polymerase-1
LPKIILQYRTLAKLKSTYTDSLIRIENPSSKRIHTSYQQAVTSTGRLSSTEPNLQNIPIKTAEGRRIREAFVPDKNNILISADYSQIELRNNGSSFKR